MYCYPFQQIEHDDSMDSSKVYDRNSSDTGSFGDVSGSSTYSTWVSGDHVHSIAQLSRSLQSIVVSISFQSCMSQPFFSVLHVVLFSFCFYFVVGNLWLTMLLYPPLITRGSVQWKNCCFWFVL